MKKFERDSVSRSISLLLSATDKKKKNTTFRLKVQVLTIYNFLTRRKHRRVSGESTARKTWSDVIPRITFALSDHRARNYASSRFCTAGARLPRLVESWSGVDRCARREYNTKTAPKTAPSFPPGFESVSASEDIPRESARGDVKVASNDAGCKDPPRKIVHQDRVYNRPSFQVSNVFERKEDKKNKLTLEYIYIYIFYIHG